MYKVRYVVGSFENNRVIEVLGFKYKSEEQLKRKLKRAEAYGWFYDGLSPLRDVDEIPDYIKVRF